jgi:hypothetical protein
MESAHAIFFSTLPSLSVQQLVSCASAYGGHGCNGGWYEYAWDYAFVYPLNTESQYPYASANGVVGTCNYIAGSGKYYNAFYTYVAEFPSDSLMIAVAK